MRCTVDGLTPSRHLKPVGQARTQHNCHCQSRPWRQEILRKNVNCLTVCLHKVRRSSSHVAHPTPFQRMGRPPCAAAPLDWLLQSALHSSASAQSAASLRIRPSSEPGTHRKTSQSRSDLRLRRPSSGSVIRRSSEKSSSRSDFQVLWIDSGASGFRPQSSSASRFTAGVPRCGRIGSLRAPLLKPRSHQRISLTSIVLDAARISSKHKPILPDLNHAVADVTVRIMELLTRPPFNAVTTPRQRRKKPARCLRLH